MGTFVRARGHPRLLQARVAIDRRTGRLRAYNAAVSLSTLTATAGQSLYTTLALTNQDKDYTIAFAGMVGLYTAADNEQALLDAAIGLGGYGVTSMGSVVGNTGIGTVVGASSFVPLNTVQHWSATLAPGANQNISYTTALGVPVSFGMWAEINTATVTAGPGASGQSLSGLPLYFATNQFVTVNAASPPIPSASAASGMSFGSPTAT